MQNDDETLLSDTETLANMTVARDIGETLHSHYPGHAWAVEVVGGMVNIKDLFISSLYGYRLPLDKVQHDYGVRVKEAMRAGGEILERAGIKRGHWTPEKVTAVEGIANYSGQR